MVSINLGDMHTIKNLLEVSCKRGTWEAHEMTTVGNLYDKLTMFINQAEQVTPNNPQGDSND